MATEPIVVVGVDGSDGSRDALVWAAGQAELIGGALRAVGSWRWPNYLTRLPPGADLQEETEQTVRDMLEPIRAAHPALTVSQDVVQGPAGPALLSRAEDATLLVVGARGRAAFPGMLLGSVAEHCVRNGPCPVVVVRVRAAD
jgi:nucleotide-binding universal stress UspA family protein